MNQEIKELTLNDNYFILPELIEFCTVSIKKNTEPEWKLDVYRFILEFLNDSEVILQKTSGTTGESKTIELQKKSLLASAKNTISFFQLKKNSVAVLCMPIQYIAGKMMVVRALVAGLNLKLIQPAGTPDFAGINNINFCAMVPMQAANLLGKNMLPQIKTLILGGAEISNELLLQLQPLETQVFETYGMAETCSHVALKRLNGDSPSSVFTALPGIRFSNDERNCLIVDAAYLPEKIITNDRVEIVAPNQFKWLGRVDNIINSGGIKIQPEILERKIGRILQKNCVIIDEPDELLGQKIALIVESAETEDLTEIMEKLAHFLDKKMLPKTIRFMKALPRNKSFKIDRATLKKMI